MSLALLPSKILNGQLRGRMFVLKASWINASCPREHNLHVRAVFFHTMSRSWKKPVFYRVHSAQTSHYSLIVGFKEHGYGAMTKVEEMLASHLSPQSALSPKDPTLPTKPVRTTSALVSKAYAASGQAAECLDTMGELQAYQAYLLGDLDKGRVIGPDAVMSCVRPEIFLSVPPRRWPELSAVLWQPWWTWRDTFG